MRKLRSGYRGYGNCFFISLQWPNIESTTTFNQLRETNIMLSYIQRNLLHLINRRTILIVNLAVGFALLVTSTNAVYAQSVSTNQQTYSVNEPIVVSFANGPGNPTDWLGIYPDGVIPDGDPTSTDWVYVNGTQAAGAGLTDGQVTFNTLLSVGDWVVWYLENDGYTALDSASFSVVDDGNSGINIGPYLQNATPTSITIMWETLSDPSSEVLYGTTSSLGFSEIGTSEVGSGSSYIHTVQLTNLTPDTVYYYQVKTGSLTSDILHFHTMTTDRETDSTFIAYSDMQEQGLAPTNLHGRLINESVSHHVPIWTGLSDYAEALDFVLVPGDLVDVGGRYTDWKEQFFDEAQPLSQHVPYFTALGNHEGGHQNYFKFMDNPENGSTQYDEQWYEFDHGNIKVITLNSNNGASEQLTWLDTVLADACTDQHIDFVFAQFHHAHISETWVPGESSIAANFVNRLVDFSADCDKASVHFYGHNHSYQRGQVRDHAHFYMDVSGAEGDLAYWGEYSQQNTDIIQKAIVEWGWSFIEVKGGSDPEFVLRRVGLGGENQDYVINFPGTEIDTVTFRPNSLPPLTPTNLSPVNQAITGDDVVLVASAFQAQESGLSHLASHFQVTDSSGDYSNPIVDQWFRWEDRYNGQNLNAGIDLTQSKDLFDLPGESTYFWRVRYRDSGFKWSEWSQESTFTTTTGGTNLPNIETAQSTYFLGDTISVEFSNAPGNTTDWIGIYPMGTVPDGNPPSTAWFYLNNSQTAPPTAIINGSVDFDSTSLAVGDWDIHLLENNGYNSLDMITIAVSESPPTAVTGQSIGMASGWQPTLLLVVFLLFGIGALTLRERKAGA